MDGPKLAPGVQDVGCHKSWLMSFTPQRTGPQVSIAPGGKLQQTAPGQVQMIPTPGMMPCMGAGCMMWDGDKNQCVDRTGAEAQLGRDITRAPVPPESDEA